MALSDCSRLPIVVTKSPRRSLRRFYIVICTLLGALALLAAMGGDDEAIYAIPVMAGIAGVFELLGLWFDRLNGYRIEIDTTGVRFSAYLKTWSEPISSYRSVFWSESYEVKHTASGGSYASNPWSIVLLHDTDPKRSVELVSSGMFSNRNTHVTAWHAAAKSLGLPTQQKGGVGVDIVDVPAVDTAAPETTEKTVHEALDRVVPSTDASTRGTGDVTPPGNGAFLEVGKTHRGIVASIPIIFFLGGAIAVTQNIAREGLEVIAGYGPILFLAVIVVAGMLGLVFTRYRIQVTSEKIARVSYLGRYEYSVREVDRGKVRQIVIHSTGYSASVALQGEEQPTIVIPSLSSFEAQRVKKFIEDALKG
jgi:hypothetical protein